MPGKRFSINYNNFNVILVDNNSDDYHLDKIIEWSQNNIKVNHKLFSLIKIKLLKLKLLRKIILKNEKIIYL